MSEPMSSTEIEDVLSSIRRLVSEDLRPVSRPLQAVPALAAEKLILTPALRVVLNDSVAVPEVFAEAGEELPPMFVAAPRVHLLEETAVQTPSTGLGSVVASVGAAVDATPSEWEAETGDVDPNVDFAPNPWGLNDDERVSFSDAEATSDEDAAVDEFAGEVIGNDADAEAEESSFSADHDHFEHRAAETPVAPPSWAQQEDHAEHDEHDGEAVTTEPLRGTIEPDLIWADAAEASVIAALSGDAAARDDEDLDAGIRFDEDVLRELVRDILREELAGRMGERITRNIRKLVRSEIARSLAAQDFE